MTGKLKPYDVRAYGCSLQYCCAITATATVALTTHATQVHSIIIDRPALCVHDGSHAVVILCFKAVLSALAFSVCVASSQLHYLHVQAALVDLPCVLVNLNQHQHQ